MEVTSLQPSVECAREFNAMLDDFDSLDPANGDFYAPARKDFASYVRGLNEEEAGVSLPEGYVPCSHRWLLAPNGEIVGVTRLRHRIDTPFLASCIGHIGYDVAPSRRGRGYGHQALAIGLSEAGRIGLTRVLLYTGEDNAASRATIERAGGQLECVAYSDFWDESLCKYWVSVPAR